MAGNLRYLAVVSAICLQLVAALTNGPTEATPDPVLVNEDDQTDETPETILVNEVGQTTEEGPNPILPFNDDENEISIGGVHVILSDPDLQPQQMARNNSVSSGGASVLVTDDQEASIDDLPEPVHQEKDFEMLNPSHVNGEELYESDIMLTPEQRAALVKRKAIISSLNYRWQEAGDGNPYVPYVFGDANVDQTAVIAGLNHWQQHTCINFGVATDNSQPHLKFIMGSGCYSYIGRIWTWAGQDISIGQGCTSLGTVAHEIGHAMGFYHEQSRNDRDTYVYINTANIQPGKEGNFDKASDTSVSNYSVPYDYSSDMHYGGTYFSMNGHLTIATINPLAQELIGSRTGLSHRDKLLANRMYKCIDKWVVACGLSSDPCLNDGYLGESCTCVCPPGTSGTYCGTITGDYYDSQLSGCSEKITSATTITSPGYPSNYQAGLQCVKWIVAPTCKKVQITFNSFRLYDQITCNDGNPCCYWDGLEIRTSNLYDGDWYCGQMTAGTSFTSTTNQMILYFKTSTNYYTGFSADVQFVHDPACPTTDNTTTSTSTPSTTTISSSSTGTSSTSTTSTSSTTSVTSTTTSPSQAGCDVKVWNGIFYWTSPNFGTLNYPNNKYCGLGGASSSPRWSFFQFQPFQLQPQVNNTCVDYVRFEYPYGVSKQYCGGQTGTKVRIPTFYYSASFRSDSSITKAGFNISLEARPSPCHMRIDLTNVGDTGVFKTPNYPRKDLLSNRMCEIWITAPETRHVRLDFLGFKLNNPCTWNSLVVNLQNQHTYPKDTSSRFCGSTLPPTMTSSESEAYLVYMANTRNMGFKVRYTVVE